MEITFQIKSTDNTNNPLSVIDLKENFLQGIPLKKGGNAISDSTIQFYLNSAVEQLESILAIKIKQQVIIERKDFISDDWIQWGYIKATYPIVCANSLTGYFANKPFITYPSDWLSRRVTNDYKTQSRDFRLVPGSGPVSYNTSVALYISSIGINPYFSWWRNNRTLPNYWELKYITGFPSNMVPADILQAVGMLATIPILGLAHDLQAGSTLGYGVASKSISIDGLSQSVSTFSNGQTGIFGARMKQYSEQLFGVNGRPGLVDTLKDAYSSIIMAVC